MVVWDRNVSPGRVPTQFVLGRDINSNICSHKNQEDRGLQTLQKTWLFGKTADILKPVVASSLRVELTMPSVSKLWSAIA